MSEQEANPQDPNAGEANEPKVDIFAEISTATGKNYPDSEAVIKALTAKDSFIEELKNENAETRSLVDNLATKLEESTNAQKVLDELKNRPENTDAQPSQTVNKDEITNLFNELVSSRETEQRVKKNLDTVNESLVSRYGDKARDEFSNKAKELGLSVEKFKELASESPQAVLAYFPKKEIVGGAAPTDGLRNAAPAGTGDTPLQAFKKEMKAQGFNPTHPQYIKEMAKRPNLFENN